jgi:hypothetical protein
MIFLVGGFTPWGWEEPCLSRKRNADENHSESGLLISVL